VASNSCPVVHKVGRHAAVRSALHSPDLTAEHPFRASRLTMGPTILDLDGQKHATGKRLLSRLFAAERIAGYRCRWVAPVVHATWNGVVGRGAVDVVEEIATRIPPQVIFGILGLPQDAALDAYRRLMRPIVTFIGDNRTGYGDAIRAHDELVAFIESHLQSKRSGEPRTIDEIVEGNQSEGATRGEAIAAVILVLLAGTETTICALANLFHSIAEYSDSWRAVLDDQLSDRAFVEEVLRLEAPVHHTHRFAVTDTSVVPESPLKRGAVVEVCLHDANHTEERITDAERWAPCEGRGMGATFGLGRHSCIGKGLALSELLELVSVLKRERFDPGSIVEREPIQGVTFRRPARIVAIC
jgi:cytochrome P450